MNSYISYILQRKKWQFVIIVVLVAVMISFAFLLPAYLGSLWSAADPLIGFITPMIATFIWLNDTKREWINSLPKKLTVHFKYKDKFVMSCIHAPLVGEHDVRAYGQSIGGQISGLRNNLPLETFFDYQYCELQSTRYEPTVNLHIITFYIYDDNQQSTENLISEYKVWFDNNNTNGKCEKLKPIYPCPTQPLTEDEAYNIHKQQETKKTNGTT